MTSFHKDAAAGALFILMGLIYGTIAWFDLPIGQAFNMGPGYFPVVLSAILAGLGIAIILAGVSRSEAWQANRVPWRPIAMILLAIILFASTLEKLGMAPCVAATAFLAALGERNISLLQALAVALGLATFSTLVFRVGFGLPVPAFGPWLSW